MDNRTASEDNLAELQPIKVHPSLKHLEWRNINVTVTINNGCANKIKSSNDSKPSQTKQILFNIAGSLEKGKLLGIMGGSGAGKSTLLNTLCGRLLSKNNTEVDGDIVYDGSIRDLGRNDVIKHISAYVMQSDILPATETVEEALLFSAQLKLPKEMPLSEKTQRVAHIIEKLKLNNCQNTFIGNDAIRGISGGEKKRTSVGVELVTDPELIFLDEPTSGLDSYTAQKTLEILKGLTEEGRQVITTIHQPSSEIFGMLDELCLLAKGHVVYFGPREDVIEYFGNLGYHCPQYTNPADYVVNQIQINPQFFADKWKEYDERKNEYRKNDQIFDNLQKLKPKSKNEASLLTQSSLLLKREANILRRDKRPTVVRFAQTVLFACFVAILYWNLPDTQQGISDRFGAVFFITINSSMTGILTTLVVFPEQRLLFEKERDSNMYSTTTYLIAKTLIGLPETCLFSLLYIAIVYWAVGLNSTFYQVYTVLTLCMLASGSMGMILGCFAKNTSEASQMMPVVFVPLLLFTNFVVSLKQIPVWLRWLQYLDVFRYVIDALAVGEFDGQKDFKIDEDGGFPNGDAYLEFLGYDAKDLAFNIYMTGVLFVGFRFITWAILVARNGW